MSIVVTGATGHLGRLIVETLLDNGIPAEDIVATGRAVDRLDDLAARGVVIRRADYSDPAGLASAFAGADKVMLVSGSEVGSRRQQHRNAVDAAVAAGAGLIVYTSIPGADHTKLLLADEHRATEAMIRDSGVPFVFLRNGWYFETYTAQIDGALDNGVIIGAAGDGLISGASRADYAAAAAAALVGDGETGVSYELGGDVPFTMTEYAAELSRQSGRPVSYQNLSTAEYTSALIGFGVPEQAASVYADADAGVARGELHVTSGDLSKLIGRPTTPLRDAIAVALAG
jgi:NAD(P)H dehydrogenase (quinone)